MIFPDAVLANADWPKRTPDTTAALGPFMGGKDFDPNQPRDEAGKWAAGPGGPNFSEVLPWKDRFPAPSEDPPPGKDYEYHATKARSLPQITQTGLRGDRTISIAPHLEAANFYGGLVDNPESPGTQAILLRMRRSDIKVGHIDDNGRVMRGIEHELDYNETREHVALQPIPAKVLQVYYKGVWHDLVQTKSFDPNQPRDEAGRWADGGGGGAWQDGLSEDESEALGQWFGDSGPFQAADEAGKLQGPLLGAISKAPAYNGLAYRGLVIPHSDLNKIAKVGAEFSIKGLTSFSRDKKIAEGFATGGTWTGAGWEGGKQPGEVSIVLRCRLKDARDIGEASYAPEQKEVVTRRINCKVIGALKTSDDSYFLTIDQL